MLSRRKAGSKLGDDLILWVDPLTIQYFVGLNDYHLAVTYYFTRYKAITKKLCDHVPLARDVVEEGARRFASTFIVKKDHYAPLRPVEEEPKYLKVHDLICHKDDYKSSMWYRDMVREMSVQGYARHKLARMYSVGEIQVFFESYLLEMIRSLGSQGYLVEKGVGGATVGADGSLHKSNSACHRFYIGRIIGVGRVPLKVEAVHAEWLSNLGISARAPCISDVARALREVEHRHQ